MSKPRSRAAGRAGRAAKASLPIWARPAPGSRRPSLTREQIAEAALGIADREGFEAVSMRRIAEALGVGTMTLYHYLRTKDDLVALMDDALIAKALLPPGEMPAGWRDGLATIARRTRDVFLKHPWAMHSLRGARIGPNSLRHVEQTMAAASSAPLSLPERVALCGVLDDFVFGYVLRSLENPTVGGPAEERAINALVSAQLASENLPHLAAFIGADTPARAFAKAGTLMSDEARFEYGLQALLDAAESSRSREGTSASSPRRRRPGRAS